MRWLGPRRISYHVVKLEAQGTTERLVENEHPYFKTFAVVSH